MNIREVKKALSRAQKSVEITEPSEMRIVRVYPYLPPGQDAIDTPCFINQHRTVSQILRPNGFRERRLVMRCQVLLAQTGVDFDHYAECLDEFEEAFFEAVAANLQLDGTVSVTNLRSNEAEFTPVVFERNGIGYIGAQYLMDVTINDIVTVGP